MILLVLSALKRFEAALVSQGGLSRYTLVSANPPYDPPSTLAWLFEGVYQGFWIWPRSVKVPSTIGQRAALALLSASVASNANEMEEDT